MFVKQIHKEIIGIGRISEDEYLTQRPWFKPKNNLFISMKLYIKYMVSLRCKMVVKEELKKIGLQYVIVELGMVEILEDITIEQRKLLKKNLLKSGLELLEDKKSILIEKIKNVIIELVHYSDELPKVNYSDYISEKLSRLLLYKIKCTTLIAWSYTTHLPNLYH